MEKKKVRLNVISLLSALLALVLVGLFFMPIWINTEYSATKEEEQVVSALLATDETTKYFSVKDLVSPSLYTETKFFHYDGEEYYRNSTDPAKEALVSKLFMMGPAILSVILLLLALIKLPWLMLLFEAAGAFVYMLDLSYIDAARKISYENCAPGIAYRAYPICFAALVILTILMIIFKGIWKHARKKEKLSA